MNFSRKNKNHPSVIKFTFTRRLYSFSKKIFQITFISLILTLIITWIWHKDFLISLNKKFITSHFNEVDNRVFCKNISITGNINYIKYDDILSVINDALGCDNTKKENKSQNRSFTEILNYTKDRLTKNPWLKKVEIYRDLPDKLVIRITEHIPFALWQYKNKLQVINEYGEIVGSSNIIDEFSHLIIIIGKDANSNIGSLRNIIELNSEIGGRIYSATWVGNRRWDIQLENGINIKLPEKDFLKSWQKFIDFYYIPGSLIDLKTIDLRISDKTFLEYADIIK